MNLPLKISSRYDRKYISVLTEKCSKQNIALISYPYWTAYSSYKDGDMWIKIIPSIDLNERKLVLLKDINTDTKKVNSPLNTESYYNLFQKILLPKRFWDSIPPEVIKLVTQFRDLHWQIVRAIIYLGEDYKNLLKTNPSLAYLMVSIEFIHPTFKLYSEKELLKRLIGTKRKEILGLAFLPATENMRKIFNKIDPMLLSKEQLFNLSRLFIYNKGSSSKVSKLLSHTKSINANLLQIISYEHEIATLLPNKIIESLSVSNNFHEDVTIIKKITSRCIRNKIKFPEITSLDRLAEIDEKNKEYLKQKKAREKKFPDPPYEGNNFIQPLRTVEEQISWSKSQHNCIRNLLRPVKTGKSYFYKVCYNWEPATLELDINKVGYRVKALRGFKNKTVSKPLEEFVLQSINEN